LAGASRSPAVEAALRTAARNGLTVGDPLVLQQTNNAVVWLRPNNIVAKVAKWTHEWLQREHALAVAIAPDGAGLIAAPAAGLGPTVDDETGYLVTFWKRLEHDPEAEPCALELVDSLRGLHHLLASYEGELHDFRAQSLQRARDALAVDEDMSALTSADLELLRTCFDDLLAQLDERSFAEQVIHGDAHMTNVLSTPSGLRWIDLEHVCRGPVEWDLAFLPEEAASAYPESDSELIELLRGLCSAQVATWCWRRADDVPELRPHAVYHLQRLRELRATS
jgi:hypothetical protein